MTSVSIIGIGNMGGAITRIAAAAGAPVQVIARDAEKTAALAGDTGATPARFGDPVTGDIVVLGVPFAAIDDIVSTYGPQLAGKVVVDITNPVDFSTFDDLAVPSDGSAAAVLQAKVPGARVVKAFNTNFASTLASGTVGDATSTVLVAGDDDAAKAAVIELVRAGGLQAEDAGSLKRARELEALGFLQIKLAATDKVGWTGGFAVVK
jgi:predicted dinucleotide-binding enzyme